LPDFFAYRDGGLASPAFAVLNAFTANRHSADIFEPMATRVNRIGCHADPPKNLAARMRHHGAFGVADRSGPVWDYNLSSITDVPNWGRFFSGQRVGKDCASPGRARSRRAQEL